MSRPVRDDVAQASEFDWEDPWGEEPAALEQPDFMRPPVPGAHERALSRALRARRVRRRRVVALALVAATVAAAVFGAINATGDEPDAAGGQTSAFARRTEPRDDPQPAFVRALLREDEAIRSGDRGDAVRALQVALAAAGFASGAGRADGIFGEGTLAAVVAFQRAHGLAPDGIVGVQTARALAAAASGGSISTPDEEVSEAAALGALPGSPAAVAEEGLNDALRTGRLRAQSVGRYRRILARTLTAFPLLAPDRRSAVDSVLGTVAAHASVYDEPRALALFSMLDTNARHLAANPIGAEPADVEGGDGTVYRFFRDRGFQFHPLANFARLNGHVTAERNREAARLASALVARGVRNGQALTWEYYFPYSGPERWTSALAQGVAAQALARAGDVLDDARLRSAARSAYLALPARLSRPLGGGRWVREYDFSDIAILNAQLQTIVSLLDYVRLSGDADGRAFTAKLTRATRALLDRFDSGCWSLYSLGGARASLHYHEYHIALLKQLAIKTGDPLWREKALLWQSCLPGRS